MFHIKIVQGIRKILTNCIISRIQKTEVVDRAVAEANCTAFFNTMTAAVHCAGVVADNSSLESCIDDIAVSIQDCRRGSYSDRRQTRGVRKPWLISNIYLNKDNLFFVICPRWQDKTLS